MEGTIIYHLSDEGRRKAFAAGLPATAEVRLTGEITPEDVAQTRQNHDTIWTIDASGSASLSLTSSAHYPLSDPFRDFSHALTWWRAEPARTAVEKQAEHEENIRKSIEDLERYPHQVKPMYVSTEELPAEWQAKLARRAAANVAAAAAFLADPTARAEDNIYQGGSIRDHNVAWAEMQRRSAADYDAARAAEAAAKLAAHEAEIAPLLAWASDHGSKRLRLMSARRIDGWESLAREEYVRAQAPAGYVLFASSPVNGDEERERRMPTEDELLALAEAETLCETNKWDAPSLVQHPADTDDDDDEAEPEWITCIDVQISTPDGKKKWITRVINAEVTAA